MKHEIVMHVGMGWPVVDIHIREVCVARERIHDIDDLRLHDWNIASFLTKRWTALKNTIFLILSKY